jgi:ABC-type Co2+ transport system permease subunit
MHSPALERHNDRVRQTHDRFGLIALVLGVAAPAAHVAEFLQSRLAWSEWPTLFGLSAAGLLAGYRPVTRWARRRAEDPTRSTRRYLRALVGGWVAGLLLAGLALRVARPLLAGEGAAGELVAGLVTAWLPFAAVALIERLRPGWLAHPDVGRSPAAPTV